MISMAGIVVGKFAQRFTQIETMIMYKHFSSSVLIFGLAIFVGLMAFGLYCFTNRHTTPA
jgi:hypothetical protein